MDAIETLTAQIKKMQKKIDELEAKNADTSALQEKLETLQSRLDSSPNFGSWDD